MPSLSQLATFVLTAVVLIVIPGPSILFVIGRALSVGRNDALLTVLGNAVGLFVQVLGVAVGLGAVIAASAAVLTVIKLVGAAYIVHLGVQAIRHRSSARLAPDLPVSARRTSSAQTLRTGFFVGLTNPKTIVLFTALLPQFIDADAAAWPQLLMLGAVFVALALPLDCTWALVASRARHWFAREPKRLDHLGAAGGVVLIGLGTFVATSKTA